MQNIQYVKVNTSTENIPNIETVSNHQRNSNYYYHSRNRNNDIDFEIYCQCNSKKNKFENRRQDKGNNIRAKESEAYHKQSFSDRTRKTQNSKPMKIS